MSNDIVPIMSFEDKLKAKIKNDIGELLSDEDLQKMVKSSINSVFFDPRPNPKYKSSYYWYTFNKPVLRLRRGSEGYYERLVNVDNGF